MPILEARWSIPHTQAAFKALIVDCPESACVVSIGECDPVACPHYRGRKENVKADEYKIWCGYGEPEEKEK